MSFSPLQWLAGRSSVRRVVNHFIQRKAKHRQQQLDRLNTVEVQERTLMNLLKTAANTRFGRDHHFDSITTIAEYQRYVPLRDYETFWQEYWMSDYPNLQGSTWPNSIPYLALSSGTTSGTTKYLPISKEMLRSNRKAGLTTMAMVQAQTPMTLFEGRLFFLGGSTDLRVLNESNHRSDKVFGGDLSGIAIREIPSVLRPYTFPHLDLALLTDWDQKLTQLAAQAAKLPVTLVSGVPSWMLVLFDRLKQITQKETLAEIWPTLQMVVHGGTKFDPYRSLFERVVGSSGVTFAETYPASEGFVATEDPRYQQLRIIPDHGIFFEFVPVEELSMDSPTRHTLANVDLGTQYAVVLTTCAGLWSYVLGDTICFESRNPPLIRFTGRTSYFLSAFGEHLISEEIEKAISVAAEAVGVSVTEFHVGPVFPEQPSSPGRHRYLIETTSDFNEEKFAQHLDKELSRLNEDYAAHRVDDLTLLIPEICRVPSGSFSKWMESKGKLGGQHKVPRMDYTGELTREIFEFVGIRNLKRDPSEPRTQGVALG